MSDISGNRSGNEGVSETVCRVAYTINNQQPVICTIIDEQPLFYMDYECDFADEDVFDSADMHILENEIMTLKQEIGAFERHTARLGKEAPGIFEAFLENKSSFGKKEVRTAKFSIEELLSVVARSRIGAAYIDIAEEHKVKISHCEHEQKASYNRRANEIQVNPHFSMEDQILLLSRELRRHWQYRNGALINPLIFHPDQAILINRLQEADLVISILRVAWELQLSDVKGAWEKLENSSLSDLARAFAREAYLDFRTLNNGQAGAAVLEAWFLSERCRNQDKQLINHMLADYQGYVFDLELARESITPSLISALGTMPFGKNYLSAHATHIMDDPIFTDVRDRSNANFLWFIKFERSFRETEQELQSHPAHIADDVRQAAQFKEQGAKNEEQQEAEIIQLFGDGTAGQDKEKHPFFRKSKTEKTKDSDQKANRSAEIIFLRRGPAE